MHRPLSPVGPFPPFPCLPWLKAPARHAQGEVPQPEHRVHRQAVAQFGGTTEGAQCGQSAEDHAKRQPREQPQPQRHRARDAVVLGEVLVAPAVELDARAVRPRVRARPLGVHHARRRHPQHVAARGVDAPAPVGLLAEEEEPLVQRTDGGEAAAMHRHAGADDGGHGDRRGGVAGGVGGVQAAAKAAVDQTAVEQLTGERGQRHRGGLVAAVGPQQARRGEDGALVSCQRTGEQARRRVVELDVGIEDQRVRCRGGRQPAIGRGGEPTVGAERQHLEARHQLGPRRQQRPQLRLAACQRVVARAVVHHDHLVAHAVRRQRQQRAAGGQQQLGAVPVDEDEGGVSNWHGDLGRTWRRAGAR